MQKLGTDRHGNNIYEGDIISYKSYVGYAYRPATNKAKWTYSLYFVQEDENRRSIAIKDCAKVVNLVAFNDANLHDCVSR